MPNNEAQYWLDKYLRENWTMPFGSICNAYGQIMAGAIGKNEAIDMDKFSQDMLKIYALSRKVIADSVGDVASSEATSEEITKVKEWIKNLKQ